MVKTWRGSASRGNARQASTIECLRVFKAERCCSCGRKAAPFHEHWSRLHDRGAWTAGLKVGIIENRWLCCHRMGILWGDCPGDIGGFGIMLRLLRVLGPLIAAMLACTGAPVALAEPGPANACARDAFRVVIDVGHTAQSPGATSARGVPEFVFNLKLAQRIEQHLLDVGFRRSVLLITEGRSRKGLAARIKRANALGADLFLSIHHDSVPNKLVEKWEFEGKQRGFSDRFSGHSIFISDDNS